MRALKYDRRYLLQLSTRDGAPGASLDPCRTGGGFFPNIHDNYIRTTLHRSFGEVAVVRGKLPHTIDPTTPRSWAAPGEVRVVLRERSVDTTRVIDYVFDEEVPVDANGNYTIVVQLE